MYSALIIISILVTVTVLIFSLYVLRLRYVNTRVNEDLVDESLPGLKILATGTFKDFDNKHKGSGTFSILKTGSKTLLQFENFKVTNGPTLEIWLSEGTEFKTSAQARQKPYTLVANLKGNIGNQVYELPNDVDVTNFNAVLIWCKLFRAVFTVAQFNSKN